VLHLDIKPANILLTKEGRAKLGDFGEAHIIQSSSTLRLRSTSPSTLSIFGVGTLDYMAPEMHSNTARKTHKVDMFSFGVVVAEVGGEKTPKPGEKLHIDEFGNTTAIPEPARRAGDIAAISSTRLRELAEKLIHNNPHERLSAQHALQFLQ
jgi:serine/threonine protein kinase